MAGQPQRWRIPEKTLNRSEWILKCGFAQVSLNRANQPLFDSIQPYGFTKLDGTTSPGQCLEVHHNAVFQFFSQLFAHLEFEPILARQTDYYASLLDDWLE